MYPCLALLYTQALTELTVVCVFLIVIIANPAAAAIVQCARVPNSLP